MIEALARGDHAVGRRFLVHTDTISRVPVHMGDTHERKLLKGSEPGFEGVIAAVS